jgi:tartrate/fumarate subfamily iron-sulfur-dependent hydro-lyase beta chain
MGPVDIQELMARGAKNRVEELRLELYDKVNALGIGAQGLGGLTTVLDVKILDYPTHAASLPVGLIPNCAATRHLHFTLDGSGPARFEPPALSEWPEIAWDGPAGARRVNLDTLTKADIADWKAGERLLLNGKLLTGRDAAHKKIADLMARGEPLPVDFTNRFIYYVGPVDPVRDEAVGPAGPTTATRMDKFTDLMLGPVGLLGMVGKSERGPEAIASIKAHGGVYCIAVGGAAYLVSKAIKSARVLGFPELGMEAIYEFDVVDMPVTVAVDSAGDSVHESGPKAWRVKIGKIPVASIEWHNRRRSDIATMSPPQSSSRCHNVTEFGDTDHGIGLVALDGSGDGAGRAGDDRADIFPDLVRSGRAARRRRHVAAGARPGRTDAALGRQFHGDDGHLVEMVQEPESHQRRSGQGRRDRHRRPDDPADYRCRRWRNPLPAPRARRRPLAGGRGFAHRGRRQGPNCRCPRTNP